MQSKSIKKHNYSNKLVCLVNPSSKIVYGIMETPDFPPLGLQYIASILEKGGFTVKAIDMDSEGINLEGLKERLAEMKPFLVGITCTTPLLKQAFKIAEIAKKTCKAKTCIGGVHPTINPMEVIEGKFVDFTVVGEGELTFLELAKALSSPRKNLGKINGLVFRHGGRVIKNKPRELIKNLDDLPLPARHIFNMNKYSYPDASKAPTISMITSRGCPGQCTYCCTKCIFGLFYRFRSADNIIKEIEHLIDEYDVKEIHIWDDNFTANKKRVLELCRKIREKGIHEKVLFSVPQGLRIDQVNEEILRALKSINVYSIGYGVESGNNRILKLCKKNTTKAKARKTVALSKKLGFDVWCFFMLGLYGDTEKTIRETIDFAKELDPLFAKFLILKPLPGTEVFNQLEAKGLILDHDYEKLAVYAKPIHRLSGVSPERLLELQKQAYKEFYFKPKKILQHLIRIRSWYRLKVNFMAALSVIKLTLARKDF